MINLGVSRPFRSLAVVATIALASVPLLAAAPSAGAAANPADQAAAQAGLVVAADLGPGWTQTPYHRSDSAAAEIEKIPACRRVKKTVKLIGGKAPHSAKAHSPRFVQGDLQLDNSTSVLANERVATKAVAVFASPLFRSCMTRVANRALVKQKKKDPKFASVIASASVSVTPQTLSLPADEEAGLGMTIKVTTKTGLAVEERVTFDVARVGRALANYNVQYGLNSTAIPSSVFAPSLERLRAALQPAAAPAA